MSYHEVFRNGRVHVNARMCDTCIFRPGNLMDLEEGRVEAMVEGAGDTGCIPCHKHLSDDEPRVCRGFFDKHRNTPLETAERLGLITFQEA